MKNDVDAAHRFDHRAGVADVTAYHLNVIFERFEVGFFAGEKVIEHAHALAFAHQSLAEVAADEPRAASDQIKLFAHYYFLIRKLPMLRQSMPEQ